MVRQYLKFFVNGGMIGLLSLLLQAGIYWVLGGDSGTAYAAATALTYLPLIALNFIIQKRWIFESDGLFWRFVLANLGIMLLVSSFAPLCRHVIAVVAGEPWGDRLGFALAALLMSVPSFFLKRFFVFGRRNPVKTPGRDQPGENA